MEITLDLYVISTIFVMVYINHKYNITSKILTKPPIDTNIIICIGSIIILQLYKQPSYIT